MLILLYAFSAGMYLLCAILPHRLNSIIRAGIFCAWLGHGALLFGTLLKGDTIWFGFGSMLSITLWLCVAAYWLESWNLAVDGLRILVLPCAALAAFVAIIFPGSAVSLAGKSIWFVGHVVIATLAYSSLTIAAFHAVLMSFQEARLHTRFASSRWYGLFGLELERFLERLPPLLSMEKILFRLIVFGFGLLSATVLSGILFSEELFKRALVIDHKNVFTLVSWCLFGVLLIGRWRYGWRGKIALRFTLSAFAILLLAYVGSRFVFEVLLHRSFV